MTGGPKTVVIGGGSGLSVLLRGLKKLTGNITAIVTMADDGGGSGVLREDLGMLPPGDIRNCILALSNTEPIMEKLLQYRFDEGTLKGQCFGNLLIAAMVGISNSFEEAIERVNDIFAVTGRVLPATIANIDLCAELENGTRVLGESEIPKRVIEEKTSIREVHLVPRNPLPIREAVRAVQDADLIVFGPGSLYTSVIPNLLIRDLAHEIVRRKIPKVYICNLMTQPGETDHYTVTDHVEALLRHLPAGVVNTVMANTGMISDKIKEKYLRESAELIEFTDKDRKRMEELGLKLIAEDFTEVKSNYLRHNALKLSTKLMGLVDVRHV